MDITSVDEFIAGYPQAVQDILQQVRATIKKAAPGAQERISYGIPTYTQGRNLVHFSGYEKHVGFYPGAQAIVDFSHDLEGYETSKGTVRFLLNKPIPYDLIDKITRYRVQAEQNR